MHEKKFLCRYPQIKYVLMGVMIRKLALSLMLLSAPLAVADTEDAAPATAEAAAEPTIAEMLENVEYLTKAKPKPKKTCVYFILRSHYNCGYCRQIAPDLVAAHKTMKGKGAEIILLSGDSDTKVAEDWAKEVKMSYPIVTNATTSHVKVKAGGSGGYPNITVVNSEGKVLDDGSGATKCKELVNNWKSFVKEEKKAAKAQKAAAKKAAKAKKKAAAEEEEDSES